MSVSEIAIVISAPFSHKAPTSILSRTFIDKYLFNFQLNMKIDTENLKHLYFTLFKKCSKYFQNKQTFCAIYLSLFQQENPHECT